MDRITNDQLNALDRRLANAYNSAGFRANQRLNRRRERLLELQTDPNLLARREQLRSAFYLLDQETNLTNDIAAELMRSRDTAARMIMGESLHLFRDGYRRQLGELGGQAGMAGLRSSFGAIDLDVINAVFNGQTTVLREIPGFQAAFTQVRYRQELLPEFMQGIASSRRRGRFYYNRALGRLGDNADLVRRLQNTLVEALVLGEGMPGITRRIQSITGSCLSQARRIARTETIRAMSQGRYLAASQVEQEYGLPMLKKWHTALDERTRASHAALNGVTIRKGELFANGLRYVGDPNGAPEETINCRCGNSYVVDLAALRSAA